MPPGETARESKIYDAIVVGLGIMGAATLSALGRSGASVIGIDQFAPPHDKGSSHGETRLLRVAYAEGAAYVPMAQRSIRLWRALEERTRKPLFTQSGVVYLAPPGSDLLMSVQESARAHNLELRDGRAGADRAALFDVPGEWRAVFEPDAGFLIAEDSVAAFLADARGSGATLRLGTEFLGVEKHGAGIRVSTSGGPISAKRAIFCIGAWAPSAFAFLAPLLRLERHVLHWYDAPEVFGLASGFAPFVVAPDNNQFIYGFVRSADGTLKLADHYSSSPLRRPSELGTLVPEREMAHVDQLVRTYLPRLGARRRSKPCIYGLSPDEHFILDEHPDLPGVFFVAGLSGHGFKFAPVLGETLANLALGERQEIDAGFFALKRFIS